MTDCYKCGSDEHDSRDCGTDTWRSAVPAARAASYTDHIERIDGYVRAFHAGQISMQAKRAAIAAENLQWYGGHVTRNGMKLTRA